MKIKNIFEKPELEVIKLEVNDIIATSCEDYKNEKDNTPELDEFTV